MGRRAKLTIELPDEFLELCEHDMIEPEKVLRGFVGDLCGLIDWIANPRADGYNSHGSDERNYARAYYDRVGYPNWAKMQREAAKENDLLGWRDGHE